ncbi:MAG: FAD-dependent oxidoreductase [Saprospiraceae bacterium]|nr:FAD-dependent oxidoreductase [Saprospiraceae bacterium]
MKKSILFLPLFFSFLVNAQKYDVCIIGGGTSGTAAGIQAARLGAKTLVIEETDWLGGMFTSAGVPAADGNFDLPSGLWAEFRLRLYKYYGGAKELQTGWVSNICFEPHVAANIFKEMASQEQYLTVAFNTKLLTIKELKRTLEKQDDTEGYNWQLKIKGKNGKQTIKARIVVDATELGDVARLVGVPYKIGTDDAGLTGEIGYANKQTDIVQDLTYSAILKTYKKGSAPLVKKPKNYDASLFQCACAMRCPNAEKVIDCDKMLVYGKLPNGKYMVNWPRNGNDFYANLIDASPKQRQKILEKAKQHTLSFLYFIQNDLGFNNLGLADDEFPTKDKLPMIAYHRESRRIEGCVTMTVNHILKPFAQKEQLYRTGIAVGDYPIDHHHDKYPSGLPQLNYPPVPSFNVPMGALIPQKVENFIVAEKSISVTNLVNGSTRLQPCVLLIGQAAGILAATAANEKRTPKDINVRTVQNILLEKGGYLMPYYDIKPNHPHFQAIQRIGATGLLRGIGEPYKWANRTWFYPDSTIQNKDFLPPFDDYGFDIKNMTPEQASRKVSVRDAVALAFAMMENKPDVDFEGFIGGVERNWETRLNLKNFNAERPITRLEIAVLFDRIAKPFDRAVDLRGMVEMK